MDAKQWADCSASRLAATTISLTAGCILGVTIIGLQACGGTDAATQPAVAGTPAVAGAFTLSVPETIRVLQGGAGESNFSIARSGGFNGSVSLAVTGASAGLTATIEPGTTTGTTAKLVVTATAAAVAGTAALTITASSESGTAQTMTAQVVIVPTTVGAGNVTADYSSCPTASRPIWFAFQDGDGAWTQVLDSAGVYRFMVASAKGGTAIVTRGSPQEVYVSLATQAELTSAPIQRCGLPEPRTVSGTLAGLGAGEVAYVGLGGGATDPEGGPVVTTSFTLTGVRDGTQDLIAYRSNPQSFSGNERLIIRRDQNIANNGTLGTIDFAAAESFKPATARMKVTGANGVELSHFMAYLTGAGCSYSSLYDHRNSGTDFTMRGIPVTQQRTTDFHHVSLYESTESSFRQVSEAFHTLADRVIVFPAPLPWPTLSTPPGRHKRVQVALKIPAEYQTSLLLYFYEQGGAGPGSGAGMTASLGWLGGQTVALAFPDLSGVTGWRNSFLPAPNARVRWSVGAVGSNVPESGSYCAENARSVATYLWGGPI